MYNFNQTKSIPKGANMETILVTKLSRDNSCAASFFIFSDQGTTKCEYFFINQSQCQLFPISKASVLSSALEFWKDVLSSVSKNVVVLTDVTAADESRDVRVTAHEIKLLRARRRLEEIKYGDIDGDEWEIPIKFLLLPETTENNRNSFKEEVKRLEKHNRIRFERVTVP